MVKLGWRSSLKATALALSRSGARFAAGPTMPRENPPSGPCGSPATQDISSNCRATPGGITETRCPAVIVGCSPAARDEDVAARLWDLSAALTGVDPTWAAGDDRPGFRPSVGHR